MVTAEVTGIDPEIVKVSGRASKHVKEERSGTRFTQKVQANNEQRYLNSKHRLCQLANPQQA